MLYKLLLFPARIFLHLYCRRVVINKKEIISLKGPLLIAANHPNSFLDAIILATLFKSPIYSLARGDAFAGKLITRLLSSLNMLPVYRVSEGVENLEHNYGTFDACQNIFKNNGIVLIFSEGRCINEWHLRPLKKGTARLAFSAWEKGYKLRVLPLGINYSFFRKFGKTVFLNFGNFIEKKDITNDLSVGKSINDFNEKLRNQLQNLVFEIDKNDQAKRDNIFYHKMPLIKKNLLFIPGIFGIILHAPLFYGIHSFIKNRAEDHYDSVMTGLLFFIYPIYVILITAILLVITKNLTALLVLILMPFSLWSYLQLKAK